MQQPPQGKNCFNRNGLIDEIETTLLQNRAKLHLLTGPRSCGKTYMIDRALENQPFTVKINLRVMSRMNKDDFMQTFKERFEVAAQKVNVLFNLRRVRASSLARPVSTTLTSLLLGGKQVVEAGLQEIFDALQGVAQTSGDPWIQIEHAIETIFQNGGTFIIHVDELNLMQSKGERENKWMDQFTEELIAFLITQTKEKDMACAILGTSDQQFAAQFAGRPDVELHCLGFMSEESVLKFLAQDWNDAPKVLCEKARNKIYASVGGHFPDLTKLRITAKLGRLDGGIKKLELSALAAAKSKGLARSRRCREGMRKLARTLVEQGYISVVEAEKQIGQTNLEQLVKNNLVQRRYPMCENGHAWAPDLPPMACQEDVLTPYLPVDFAWLRNYSKHFPREQKDSKHFPRGLLSRLLR